MLVVTDTNLYNENNLMVVVRYLEITKSSDEDPKKVEGDYVEVFMTRSYLTISRYFFFSPVSTLVAMIASRRFGFIVPSHDCKYRPESMPPHYLYIARWSGLSGTVDIRYKQCVK